MRNRYWTSLAVLLFLLVLTIPQIAAGADNDVWVRVRPVTGSYDYGQEFDVDVLIEDVVDLYGADVRLDFDAARLQVVDADPALPGVQLKPSYDLIAPDFIIRNQANNAAGTTWYAATQLRPSEPVSGSGVLYSVRFKATGPGLAEVKVSYHALARRDGIKIPSNAAGATYQVVGGSFKSFLPMTFRRH